MFDIEKNKTEHDPLKAQFQGMKGKFRASAELKEALKTGTPLHTLAVGKRVHVRRFSRAIAVYAVCALLLLGTAIALPSLLKGMGPTPAGTSTTDSTRPTPQEEMLSPGELYEQLYNAPNLTYRMVDTVYNLDGNVRGEEIIEMVRNGDRFTQQTYTDGEKKGLTYYEIGADESWAYYSRNGLWFTEKLPDHHASWAFWCENFCSPDFLKDEHYEKTNDGYVFTEEYIAQQIKDFKCEDAQGILTEKDGVYTLRVVRYTLQFGTEPCDVIFEIQISFGNAPEIGLPKVRKCEHEYEVEVIPSEHPCILGDELRFTCKNCGDYYNEWSVLKDHNIVDGVCTVCNNIEADLENYPDRGGNFHYYGTYNGCIIVHQQGMTEAIEYLKVGGVLFWHTTGFSITVYRGSEIAQLSQAYEKGWLDDVSIAEIGDQHEQMLREHFGDAYNDIRDEMLETYEKYHQNHHE